MFAEEEEVGEVGVGGLEVVERDGLGDPFGADGGEDFHAESAEGVGGLCLGVCRAHFLHCEENWVVLVQALSTAVIFVDALE